MKSYQSDHILQTSVICFIAGWVHTRTVPGTKLLDLGPLKHVHFGAPVGGRTDEFFLWDASSDVAVQLIAENHPNLHHWLTVFSTDATSTEADYKKLGYYLRHSEYLMTATKDECAQKLKSVTITHQVQRVDTIEQVDWLNNHFQKQVVDPQRTADPMLRHYVIEMEGVPVTYGRYSIISGVVCFDNIFTSPSFRGHGLAASLCNQMLIDSMSEGATSYVLASSQMGRPIYSRLGFKEVAYMSNFDKRDDR